MQFSVRPLPALIGSSPGPALGRGPRACFTSPYISVETMRVEYIERCLTSVPCETPSAPDRRHKRCPEHHETSMTVTIRSATEGDQQQILALARGERLKPFGLNWPNFIVAERDGRIIGAVQLRGHWDGSCELGSLVVEATARGQGIAARLIDRRLADTPGRVLIITGRRFADHYRRWGFEPIAPTLPRPASGCTTGWDISAAASSRFCNGALSIRLPCSTGPLQPATNPVVARA